MLYLSRIVSSRTASIVKYGIVDTDDDTETMITWEELCDIVIHKHIDIKGVVVMSMMSGNYISDTYPYQDMRYYSAKQARTKTLQGVDVRVWRNKVTCIIADGNMAKSGVKIRLSDFGTELCSRAYIGWLNTKEFGAMMTIVLDDKITSIDCSAHHVNGVRWDISEVTNQSILDSLLGELSFILNNPRSIQKYLIDKHHRYDDKWRP